MLYGMFIISNWVIKNFIHLIAYIHKMVIGVMVHVLYTTVLLPGVTAFHREMWVYAF